MGADAQTQALRDLVSLADKLRNYAVQTDDAHYIALFLATAETLEARATALGGQLTTLRRGMASPEEPMARC